jgi:integrase
VKALRRRTRREGLEPLDRSHDLPGRVAEWRPSDGPIAQWKSGRPRHHPQSRQRRRPLRAAVRNPALNDAPPKQHRRELQTWTAQQLRQFLDSVQGERLYARLARGGTDWHAPRGEVLRIRWGDLDIDRGWLSVRQALVVVDRVVQVSLPKTDRGRRLIALDPGTTTALRAHHTAQAADRLALGPTWPGGELVFTRETASPCTQTGSAAASNAASTAPRSPRSASTTCATPTPPWPTKQACTQGDQRAARPRHRGDDPGHLLPRHPALQHHAAATIADLHAGTP